MNLEKNYLIKYGHSIEDRYKVTKLYVDVVKEQVRNGKFAIMCCVTHKRVMRELARAKIKGFSEIYIQCSPSICAKRDYKGLYSKAIRGEIDLFPGITEPYEESEKPDLVIDTYKNNIDSCISILFDYVKERYIDVDPIGWTDFSHFKL